LSAALNSALKAVVQTINDDDEDEASLEQYVANLINNLFSELFGFGAIPYVSDFFELIKSGFDPERADMAFFSNIYDTFKILSNENKTAYEKIKALVGLIGFGTGIPATNLWRAFEGFANGIKETVRAVNGEAVKATKHGVEYAIKEKIGFGYKKPSDLQQLVMAYLDNDDDHYERQRDYLLDKYGGDEDKLNSQILSAIGKLYKDNKITKGQAKKLLKGVLGLDDYDAHQKIKKWDKNKS
jgi:hypothetical protein